MEGDYKGLGDGGYGEILVKGYKFPDEKSSRKFKYGYMVINKAKIPFYV